MRFVRSAKYLSDYKLLIGFDNGAARIVDLKRHLNGEIFRPLKNLAYFRRVRVDPDIETIVWDNDADFSPDFLFAIGTPAPRAAVRALRAPGCATYAKAKG